MSENGGVSQYWIVDPATEAMEIFELHDGRYQSILQLDRRSPESEVTVGEHGTMRLTLADVLDR